MKTKRFFYHYYRQKKMMSVHYNGVCSQVDNIVCNVPCETKFRKRQPFLVMQGWATEVKIKDGVAIIS
jgi:hypothetical protein